MTFDIFASMNCHREISLGLKHTRVFYNSWSIQQIYYGAIEKAKEEGKLGLCDKLNARANEVYKMNFSSHNPRNKWNTAQRKVAKKFGDFLATLISKNVDDVYDFILVLNKWDEVTMNFPLPSSVINRVNEFVEECLRTCEECGALINTEDSVYSDSHNGYVCDSCAEYLVFTHDTEQYILADEATLAYTQWDHGVFSNPCWFENTDTLCPIYPSVVVDNVTHVTGDSFNASYWNWRNDGYQEGIHPDYEDEEEDEEEEQDYEIRNGVYDYDKHPLRDSFDYFDEPKEAGHDNVPIGMELECHVRGEPLEALQLANLVWILEVDGSLCPQYGVEVVSPPLCRKQWETVLPVLTSALTSEGGTAYTVPDDRMYGIHLTVSREYLTPLQELRISLFLLAQENAEFVRAVAQRWNIYSHSSGSNIGCLSKVSQRVSRVGGLSRRGGKPQLNAAMGKYSPLYLKGSPNTGLAEFRIFRSTLKSEMILKNMEFVWALLAWTDRKTVSGCSWNHLDFAKWVREHKKQYPTLAKYLRKSEYRVKQGAYTIVNNW